MASLFTLSADDRDAIKSNLTQLGAHGALSWASKRLAAESGTLQPSVRRILILTVIAAARELELEVRSARRLARCHASGMRQQQKNQKSVSVSLEIRGTGYLRKALDKAAQQLQKRAEQTVREVLKQSASGAAAPRKRKAKRCRR